MADTQDELDDLQDADELEAGADGAAEEAEEPKVPLQLDVKIDKRSACERHIVVQVSRADIDRYFDKEFNELMPDAQVPGFRKGRAPRKLVEARFRKDIGTKVKTELLMDSLAQLGEEQQLTAISEPELDLGAVELPAEGPLTFEFDIEVRPEFAMPQWRGLQIERPAHEIAKADVDRSLQAMLDKRGRLVPHDGPAAAGDSLTCNLTFRHGGQTLATASEQVVRLKPTLSFRDGRLEGFDALMAGAQAGESREGEMTVAADAANEPLRGEQIRAQFDVLEVKRLEPAQLTPELLEELGAFKLEADLRDAIQDTLARRLDYEQRQRARRQITSALIEAANWELPPALLQRQSRRELQRAILELQRSGFGEDEIKAHENELRQNSRVATAQALKEHFILERIAEEEEIEAEEADYEQEIHLIAVQTGESVRRVRARLEKGGAMDVLRNQIIERKVIDVILEHARFKEVPFDFETPDVEAVDLAVSGGSQGDIPEAKPGGEAPAPGGRPEEHRPHV